MCDKKDKCCDKKVITKIGPKGKDGKNGTNGRNGTNGTNGTNGINGTNGSNGTNAFKFIKEFTTEDIEQQLTITQEELTACGALPIGCLADGTAHDMITDFHVRVYFEITNGWRQGDSRYPGGPISPGVYTYTLLLVNPAFNPTSDINIQLDNFIGRVRVVILG